MQRIRQSKQSKQQKEQLEREAAAALDYEFDMEFVQEEVCKKIEAFADELGLAPNQLLPVPLLIEVYDQQDFAIAQHCNLIKDPTYWDIQVQTTFVHPETGHTITHDFDQELGPMKNSEMMMGAKEKIVRKGGFKTRWRGLLDELDTAYSDDQLRERGYKDVYTAMYLKFHASFINATALQHYNDLLKARDEGRLLRQLETMELALFKAALMDGSQHAH